MGGAGVVRFVARIDERRSKRDRRAVLVNEY
jgi:hypothetical protein